MPARGWLLWIIWCLALACRAADTPPAEADTPPSEVVPAAPQLAEIRYGIYHLTAGQIDLLLSPRQRVTASGGVTVESPRGIFLADYACFCEEDGTGELVHARGRLDPFRFTARKLILDTAGKSKLQHARITTCTKTHPHYELSVRDVTIDAQQQIKARGVAAHWQRYTLFTVPQLTGSMGGGEHTFYVPRFTAGQTGVDGTYLGMTFTGNLSPVTPVTLTGRFGSHSVLRGGLTINHSVSLGPTLGTGTLTFVASQREDVRNRLVDIDESADERLQDVTVSRLPALLFAMGPVNLPTPLGGFSLLAGGGYGRYREYPTKTSANRAQAWGVLRTPRVPVGPLALYGEYGVRGAYYDTDSHITSVLQVSLESPIEHPDGYYHLSYLHRGKNGTSPFLFDRVLIPDEIYSEVEVPVAGHGRWRLGAWNRFDVKNERSRDLNITAIFKEDCISYGLIYNQANQSLGVGVAINAFGNFRKGLDSIGFTQ